MKQRKNKIIFLSALVLISILMVGYYMRVVADDPDAEQQLEQPKVPELEETQKEYSSKLDAVNDVKEKRETTAPSVYAETFIDSTGRYDPDLEEKRRQRIVDSIYRNGRIDYASGSYRETDIENDNFAVNGRESEGESKERPRTMDFSEAHNAFFLSHPHVDVPSTTTQIPATDAFIIVEVNGEQTVRTDGRLELRLAVDAEIEGETVPRNTLLYGFVAFKANRVLVNITTIEHRPVSLKAFDLLDGNEGIYVENSFRAEAGREILDDVVQDINIPGVPQVGGIKQVFRRNNRNVKVTVRNQYQLILKGS